MLYHLPHKTLHPSPLRSNQKCFRYDRSKSNDENLGKANKEGEASHEQVRSRMLEIDPNLDDQRKLEKTPTQAHTPQLAAPQTFYYPHLKFKTMHSQLMKLKRARIQKFYPTNAGNKAHLIHQMPNNPKLPGGFRMQLANLSSKNKSFYSPNTNASQYSPGSQTTDLGESLFIRPKDLNLKHNFYLQQKLQGMNPSGIEPGNFNKTSTFLPQMHLHLKTTYA